MNLSNGLKNGNSGEACNHFDHCWNWHTKHLFVWSRNIWQKRSGNFQSWITFYDPCAKKSVWNSSGMQVSCYKKPDVPKCHFWLISGHLPNYSNANWSPESHKFTNANFEIKGCQEDKNLILFLNPKFYSEMCIDHTGSSRNKLMQTFWTKIVRWFYFYRNYISCSADAYTKSIFSADWNA